jgi:pyruvate,orthophosphate dikinase
MQARAIMEAACQVTKEGGKAVPEIMIPLVGDVLELADQKKIVVRVAEAVIKERGVKVKYLVGTMIEVPRGAIMADEIAREADFFSFGTNDLTQLTYGFSRDDIGKFLGAYQERKILGRDPFASLDTVGVGALVEMGTKKGRSTKPNLKIGICGEHGGDPSSIHFFHKVGFDYVSCSPFRVPVARMAAAQAALLQKAAS